MQPLNFLFLKGIQMNAWFEKLYDTFIVDDNYMMLLKGFGNTLIITLCALLIGVLIGGIIAIAKYYAEGNRKDL